MKQHKIGLGIAFGVALGIAAPSLAQQAVQWRVEDGGNGHWYALYDHGSSATRGRHASTAWTRGAKLAAFELVGERQAILGLLSTQISSLPTGTQILLAGLGQCVTTSSCFAHWGTGQPTINDGWVPGEPAGSPGVQLVHMDKAGGLWAATPNLRYSLWEWSADCDEDGVVDLTAIHAGSVPDVDGNRIPDSCDTYRAINLVQNGSFEAEPDGQCCTSVSAWSGSVDRVDTEWFPFDGGSSIDLNTGSAQYVQQSIAIAQPGDYRLSFWYSANCGDCGAGFQRRFRLTIGGLSETIDFDTTSWSDPAQPWFHFDRVVSLPSGSHPLRLQSLLGGCTGPAIDGIAIRSARDCDSDGVSDVDEFRMRMVSDVNGNGVPDTCDCPADINQSGTIDAEDLAYVLFAWGMPGGKAGGADINGDAMVDANDLSLVLGSWGPCPD